MTGCILVYYGIVTKQQKKVLDTIPVKELVQEARRRARDLAVTRGAFATLKRFISCPDCGVEFGVRELRRHRSEARRLGRCPKKVA